MGDWRTKNDQDLTATDIANMRQAAIRAAQDAAISMFTAKRMAELTPEQAEMTELSTALDQLWGMLAGEQVQQLESDAPEIVDACRANHERLWH